MAELDTVILRRAGKLLAKRPYSRSELRGRLLRLAEEARVEKILGRLQSLNLLNDSDYAYNFALRRKSEKGWASEKIRIALMSRGISAPVADSAIQRAEAECGETAALRQSLERIFRRTGLPRDAQTAQRLFLRLIRQGFSEESIQQVMREMIPGTLYASLHLGE